MKKFEKQKYSDSGCMNRQESLTYMGSPPQQNSASRQRLSHYNGTDPNSNLGLPALTNNNFKTPHLNPTNTAPNIPRGQTSNKEPDGSVDDSDLS